MNNNQQNNDKRFELLSWLIIVGLFLVGGWPIATVMLFYKLFGAQKGKKKQDAPSLSEFEARKQAQERAKTEEKERAAKEVRQNVKALFDAPKDANWKSLLMIGGGVFVLFISLIVLMSKYGYMSGSIILTLISLALSGAGLVVSGYQMRSAIRRYARYLALIGVNDAVEIESLVKKTGYSKRKVEKDLDKMIDKGYFGKTAYLNKELGYFFTSSQADEELERARKAAMEKTAKAAKEEAVKQTETLYDNVLAQLRDVNLRIPGEEMTAKISKIEEITRNIFDEVKKNPDKRKKIDRFMSYYLPTALKLLEHYAELDSRNMEGENINRAKLSIENAMDSIVEGFSRQLDDLYKNDDMDIETDIDVMLKMMNRDSQKSKSEFKTGKTDVNLGGSAGQTK